MNYKGKSMDLMKNREDIDYLQLAIEQSRNCIASDGAYSVGAVVVTAQGAIFTGYTHQRSPTNHAEEEAIGVALAEGASLNGATIYSSLEPCSVRASKPKSCTELIIECGFRRVVYALCEPPHFVDCHGSELLKAAGIEVVQVGSLAEQVREINAHILNK